MKHLKSFRIFESGVKKENTLALENSLKKDMKEKTDLFVSVSANQTKKGKLITVDFASDYPVEKIEKVFESTSFVDKLIKTIKKEEGSDVSLASFNYFGKKYKGKEGDDVLTELKDVMKNFKEGKEQLKNRVPIVMSFSFLVK